MVQVGLGPGGSCLLTQEEPPPALLPATRHDLAGAGAPAVTKDYGGTDHAGVPACSGPDGGGFLPFRKMFRNM